VNVITARGIFGLIATIYLAGVLLHFWYILIALVVLMLLVSVRSHYSKPKSTVPAATLVEARRIQAYYSNRR
jgi:hypothetical protein